MWCRRTPFSILQWDNKSFVQNVATDAMLVISRAKVSTVVTFSKVQHPICPPLLTAVFCLQAAYSRTFGLGQDELPATSVFAMPMLPSSRMRWRHVALDNHWSEAGVEDYDLDSPAATGGV